MTDTEVFPLRVVFDLDLFLLPSLLCGVIGGVFSPY